MLTLKKPHGEGVKPSRIEQILRANRHMEFLKILPAITEAEDRRQAELEQQGASDFRTKQTGWMETPPPAYPFRYPGYLKYLEGGPGMVAWCEDHLALDITPVDGTTKTWTLIKDFPAEKHPETHRSYRDLWYSQAHILTEALRMDDRGMFRYRYLFFCWERGEGKSYVATFILLWLFFNFPQQNKMLLMAGNSKEQSDFILLGHMKKLIKHSPKLLDWIGGKRNIQKDRITLTDNRQIEQSSAATMGTKTGLMPNTTVLAITELHLMSDPTVYEEAVGSLREMINPLVIVDSTVAGPNHILTRTYRNCQAGKLPQTFFSYRCSREGDPADYMSVRRTRAELDSFRHSLTPAGFAKHFLNLFSYGGAGLYSEEMIRATEVLYFDGDPYSHQKLLVHLEEISRVEDGGELKSRIQDFRDLGIKFKSSDHNIPILDFRNLEKLGEIYQTPWSILVGIDLNFSDTGKSNACMAVVAKGYPGLKQAGYLDTIKSPIYILIGLLIAKDHRADLVKTALEDIQREYYGIDRITIERNGNWDISQWCVDNCFWDKEETKERFIAVSSHSTNQRVGYREFSQAIREGRFKAPPVPIFGIKEEDAYKEEMRALEYNADKDTWGSKSKGNSDGINDDTQDATMWAIFGGRDITDNQIPRRRGVTGINKFGSVYDASGSCVSGSDSDIIPTMIHKASLYRDPHEGREI